MQAIFFDAHGVLYHRIPEKIYLMTFLGENDFTIPDVRVIEDIKAVFHDQALRGQINIDEYHNAILARCGVTGEALLSQGRVALDKDHGNIRLYAGVKDTLPELKTRGFKLGVITDAAVTRYTKLEWLKREGLHISWDAYANSMDLGVRKPDKRMYQEALTQAGVSSAESVFVGHDRRELDGARNFGMTTVAFNQDLDAEADYTIEHFVELLDLPFLKRAR